MSENDYERAFVDAFQHITRQAEPEGIDPEQVGPVRERSAIRRTPLLWLAAAAIVLGVAAIGFGLARHGLPTPAVPLPEATSTPAARTHGTAILRFPEDASLPFYEVTVDLSGSGDTIAARISAIGDPAVDVEPRRLGSGVFWSARVSPRLTVAVIPGEADQVIDASGASEAVHSQYVPDVGVTVAAVQSPQPGDTPVEVLWRTPEGRMLSSQGQSVASAALSVSDEVSSRSVVIFRDEGLDVWGFIDETNDVRVVRRLDTEPVGTLFLSMGTADGENLTDLLGVGCLPAGGSAPEPVLADAGALWDAAPLHGDNRTCYLVFAHHHRQGEPLLKSLTYSDASGRKVTLHP